MKTLRFDYQLQIFFEQPITEHYFTLKCIPQTLSRQKILKRDICILPNDYYQLSEDGFGNLVLYGYYEKPHTKFEVHVTGQTKVNWANYDKCDTHNYILRTPTRLTKMSREMILFANEKWGNLKFFHMSKLNQAHAIMDTLYQEMQYESGSTEISTTAAQSFAQRKGVCQDYAHIMIAFCRYYGIPARYVAGMMIGEGYSHAWVEIYSNGRWYGFDPTNYLLIDSNYIIFAVGRDYDDCILNKGYFYGAGEQKQKIYVKVEEL